MSHVHEIYTPGDLPAVLSCSSLSIHPLTTPPSHASDFLSSELSLLYPGHPWLSWSSLCFVHFVTFCYLVYEVSSIQSSPLQEGVRVLSASMPLHAFGEHDRVSFSLMEGRGHLELQGKAFPLGHSCFSRSVSEV